jgi:hypothetical protein
VPETRHVYLWWTFAKGSISVISHQVSQALVKNLIFIQNKNEYSLDPFFSFYLFLLSLYEPLCWSAPKKSIVHATGLRLSKRLLHQNTTWIHKQYSSEADDQHIFPSIRHLLLLVSYPKTNESTLVEYYTCKPWSSQYLISFFMVKICRTPV